MSLILDALRKSEAERQRGQAPSLHAPASRVRALRRNWPLAGTVAALALVGGASWLVFRTDSVPVRETDAQASDGLADAADARAEKLAAATEQVGSLSTAAPLQRESAPMLASADGGSLGGTPAALVTTGGSGGGEWPDPALNVAATAAAQPYQQQAAATPEPAVQPATPAPVAVAPAVPDAAARQVDGLSDPSVRPFVAAAPVEAAVVTAEPSEPALPSVHDLDFAVRRDLPKLNMSMLVYAKDPQRRFALVNGKRYVPGGEAIDGKVLVIDILPDGLVCEINGHRFLLPRQ